MKVLLVVDMIKGFLEESTGGIKCNLYVPGAKAIIPNIEREIASLGAEDAIIFVRDCHDPNDKEFETWPKHCIRGSEETHVVYLPRLPFCSGKAAHTTFTISKTRYSAFYKTILDTILSELRDVDTIIVTGLCTEICVFATALDARYRDYKVVIPGDCVFPLNVENGGKMMAWLQSVAGVELR